MVNSTLDSPAVKRSPSGHDVELADVVRQFALKYRSQYGNIILPSQTRALVDIEACCTKALGGRLYLCEDCEKTFWSYHCCRNRACPKCHGSQMQQWLEQRQAELLPCDYFHVVATVPSELHDLFRRAQKTMYGLLMNIAATALKQLCAKRRHLGALPGILSVLHTWTGALRFHPHVHMLVTGGGVTQDGTHFERARRRFLVPVQLLSRRIARMFRDTLHRQYPELFANIPESVWRREWVSFCKHYGHGNDAVLNYLSRYVFRTAISNARILELDDTHVTFRYKDRSTDTWRTMRLPGIEFLRRFLQHVLPRGFHKVRYFGLWHSSKRHLASRVWLLLMFERPMATAHPPKIADLLESLQQLADTCDLYLGDEDLAAEPPCCPYCSSRRTTFLAEYPRFGIP